MEEEGHNPERWDHITQRDPDLNPEICFQGVMSTTEKNVFLQEICVLSAQEILPSFFQDRTCCLQQLFFFQHLLSTTYVFSFKNFFLLN